MEVHTHLKLAKAGFIVVSAHTRGTNFRSAVLRKIRIYAPDALHHIIIRGIEQRKNFIVLIVLLGCVDLG